MIDDPDPLPPPRIWPRLLRNTGWLLGARALNAPLGLLESVILARFLGVQDYGTLGLVMATVTVMQRLFSFRMNEFTVRYLTETVERGDKKEAGATLKLAMVAEACSAAAAFLVAVLAAPLLARYFLSSVGEASLIRLFALVALANGLLETSTAALQVFDRFRFLAATNVLRKAATVAGFTAFLIVEASVAKALAIYVGAAFLAAIIVVATLGRTASRELGARWWTVSGSQVRAKWREMGSFALTTNLGGTLSLIIKDSDLLWIGFFGSPEAAGYFKLAKSFLKVPFAAGSPMTKAFYPEISRLEHGGSRQRVRKFLRQTTLISAGWVLPVAAITALLAPFLIEALYGESFLPAVPAVWILLIGLTLANILFWTRPTLLAMGRPEIPLKIAIFNAILKVGLALTLVPTWGYLGLSAILSGLYVSGLSLYILAIRRELRQAEAGD